MTQANADDAGPTQMTQANADDTSNTDDADNADMRDASTAVPRRRAPVSGLK
jgi:hypothetical protein